MSGVQELLNPVHSPEKKKILEAIATKGPRLVPVDVATDTGLALPLVISELNNIASETQAHLEVTESGNIAYTFQGNLQQAYIANASRQLFLNIWRVFANVSMIVLRAFCALMFFLVRISFGIALIVAFVAVIALVVVAVIAMIRGGLGGDDNDNGGGGFNLDLSGIFDWGYHGGYYHRPFYLYWLFDWLWDWFFFWRYVIPDPYSASRYPSQSQSGQQEQAGKKTNFLNNVFLYLFGDGNPNIGFEELKWQTIARLLELNSGVVTAEQLAPYLGQDPKDEDWMIPVLQRFNGTPEVSESGNIIYLFPAFQSNAGAESIPMISLGDAKTQTRPVDELADLVQRNVKRQSTSNKNKSQLRTIDRYLAEREWPFLNINEGSLVTIILFAIVVAGGGIGLLANMSSIPVLAYFAPLIYLLTGYGALFFIIPGIRYLIYEYINGSIEKRNTAKQNYAAILNNPSPELAKKLSEAQVVRLSGMPKKPDRTIYTTDKDVLDQDVDELGKRIDELGN